MHESDALRESEARFAALFEHGADALLVVDTDGRIELSNPAASRLFGYTNAELCSMAIEELIPEAKRARHRDLRAAFHRAPHARLMSETMSLTALAKGPREVPVEVGLGPVTLGDRPMVLTSVRDISSRVAAQERLREAERQAAESQKLEAVGRLAAGVAHDFNNLLTIIMASTDMLLGSPLGVDERAIAREVLLASQRAAELTGQLLAFARTQRSHGAVVSLSDRIHSFSPLLQRLVRELQINFQLSSDALLVRINPAHVDQIVLNLVLNARDAMSRGAIVVKTYAEPGEGEAQSWSVLEVTDHGEGMDDDTRQRLFEPFFTTKPVGQGTGLGLSTVHGLVTQAGGFISVSSTHGAGSTFRVRLPSAPR